MNLDKINQELEQAVNDGCRMVSVMLFRRKVNNKWEWVYDTKRIEEDGSLGEIKRAVRICDDNINVTISNDTNKQDALGAGSFI